MTGILLSGCNGKMGKVITAAAANTDDIEMVGGIDLNTPPRSPPRLSPARM